MIVVKVELWSAISGHKTELARMVIDNVGGTDQLGDYRCRTLRGRSAEALDRAMLSMDGTGATRSAAVLRHHRLREHVWNLVAKALTAMAYGQKGGAA